MSEVIKINNVEQLAPFLNKDKIIEIVVRGKNKKFKAFQKIAIEKLGENQEQKEALKKVINELNKNYKVNVKNMNLLNNVAKLNQFNLLMNGLNLCATCAGFIIVCQKIDGMSDQINEVLSTIKSTNDLQLDYEFKKCVSEHTSMLDHRKTQDYFSLDRMEKLVSKEYDVLESMVKYFTSNVISDKGVLLYSIMTMASMLSVSLRYYDEIYYYEYKDKIGCDQIWHTSHEKWVSIFEKISTGKFIETVQDYSFLDLGLTTSSCDAFYENIIENSQSYKQEIIDNQEILTILGSKEKMDSYNEYLDKEVEETILNEMSKNSEINGNNELKKTINDTMVEVGIVH